MVCDDICSFVREVVEAGQEKFPPEEAEAQCSRAIELFNKMPWNDDVLRGKKN